MDAKVSDELLKQVEKAEKEEPQREIPVIITIRADVDPMSIQQKGLKIQHIFKNTSAISGILTADKVKELIQMDQVEIVEYDGPMHILSDRAKK